MTLDKATNTTHCGKDSLFNKRCWENSIFPWKRVKLGVFLAPYTRINLKGIKDLDLSTKLYKSEEDKIVNIHDIGFDNFFFLDMISKLLATGKKIR